ncbi:hypothetical protein AVEN_185402-1 [Araneus ventricosus]|uniref:Uncharacterized protein n=1 Tax=Araneus ventricosus TaxID=182803 RepID=A0A4Y2CHR4_ARAVE|nr:hypothetical protein AVEN_185402-1 [Araneus ventricosus]
MERNQGNKLVVEIPECDSLTGNMTPTGTTELVPYRIGAPTTGPSPRLKVFNTCNHELSVWSEHPKGRSLTWLLCLLTLAGHIGLAFTPRVALPGKNLPMYFTQTASVTPATLRQPVRLEGGHPMIGISGAVLVAPLALPMIEPTRRRCLDLLAVT